jgi:hypothetical protein
MSNSLIKQSNASRSADGSAVRLPHLERFAVPPRDGGWREEPTTICGDILHAAHTEAKRLGADAQAPAPNLEAMLGVISYCYAKGLFNSVEIEHELWETPAFLASFGNKLPTAQQIRSFRRHNRPIILSVVEQALQEFSNREPCWVREQVIAAEADLTVPAQALARWLLDMANYSDSMETE